MHISSYTTNRLIGHATSWVGLVEVVQEEPVVEVLEAGGKYRVN